jgi:hypothetical protein
MNEYCRDFLPMERIINWNEYTLKESEQTSNNGGNIRSHLKAAWAAEVVVSHHPNSPKSMNSPKRVIQMRDTDRALRGRE